MTVRSLTDAEIVRLLVALSRDGIDAGYLRPFLWRRRRMVPPPLFLPLSSDGLVNVVLVLLGALLFGFPHALWLGGVLLCIGLVIALVVDMRQAGDRLGGWRIMLCLVVICPLAALLVIYRPVGWPGEETMSDRLSLIVSLLVICLVANLIKHWRQRRRRRLPRWADYVEAALVAETF